MWSENKGAQPFPANRSLHPQRRVQVGLTPFEQSMANTVPYGGPYCNSQKERQCTFTSVPSTVQEEMDLYVYDMNCNQIGIHLGAPMTPWGGENAFNFDSELNNVIIVFQP
jgi:hypothetical protein